MESAEDAIAHRHTRDGVAGRDDRSDVLVPDCEPRVDLDAPVVDVQIRAAYPGGLDAYDGVVGGDRLRIGTLLDGDPAGLLKGHGAHGAA